VTAAEEVQEARHALGLNRSEFAKALGLGPRGYAQVRKWEAGVGEPSAAALTAMRLLVELGRCRRLPWMTPALWDAAQTAHDELRARAEQHEYRRDYPALHAAVLVLRALLAQRS
jgi:transcriptional regulator with XRE-family HTH domain